MSSFGFQIIHDLELSSLWILNLMQGYLAVSFAPVQLYVHFLPYSYPLDRPSYKALQDTHFSARRKICGMPVIWPARLLVNLSTTRVAQVLILSRGRRTPRAARGRRTPRAERFIKACSKDTFFVRSFAHSSDFMFPTCLVCNRTKAVLSLFVYLLTKRRKLQD